MPRHLLDIRDLTTQELDAFINNIVTEIKERRYN